MVRSRFHLYAALGAMALCLAPDTGSGSGSQPSLLGDDTLAAGAGDDTLRGGAGDDTIQAATAADPVTQTAPAAPAPEAAPPPAKTPAKASAKAKAAAPRPNGAASVKAKVIEKAAAAEVARAAPGRKGWVAITMQTSRIADPVTVQAIARGRVVVTPKGRAEQLIERGQARPATDREIEAAEAGVGVVYLAAE